MGKMGSAMKSNASITTSKVWTSLQTGVDAITSMFNNNMIYVKDKYQGGWLVNFNKKNKYMYNYPMAQLTVDLLYKDENEYILFIVRKRDPFKECLALPGGFVDIKDGEEPEDAALREGKEECNLLPGSLTLVTTVGNLTRDPRGYTCTSLYFANNVNFTKAMAGDDARELHMVHSSELKKFLTNESESFQTINPATHDTHMWHRKNSPDSSVFAFDHEQLLIETMMKGFF